MTVSKAVRAIQKRGILLVFPIQNRPEPRSLWSEFYPKSQMKWEWDSGGDGRVASLWHLREELSRSRKVVYTKWYKGRATFFSREVFSQYHSALANQATLSRDSKMILEILLGESPLSTKELKKQCKMEGRFEEKSYVRALKDLWTRLLIVGFGEVDDGAFPSLAIGATEVLFEELTRVKVKAPVEKNLFSLELEKCLKSIASSPVKKGGLKTVKGKDLQLF